MERIGLIGLGLLGSALAARLRAAGYEVHGYDLAVARRDEFSATGGHVARTAQEVAAHCQTLVLCLPDSNVAGQVVEALGNQLRAGQWIVDTSTGEPCDAENLAGALAPRGITYLDATILGSSEVVRRGEAVVMVGGEHDAVQPVRPILAYFGRQTFHVGPVGSGARMKLVVNLVLGLNRAVLAEGLTLGNALGLDLALVLEVLRAGAAYSTVMDAKGAKMLTGDFTPQARLSQHLKDVRLMLSAAATGHVRLPLSEVHQQLLERAEAAGFGDADNSAVLRAFGMPARD